jgi:tRNA pseudouridine32 synthase/23S rRNA pseudouridine746 synthase
VVEGGPRGEEGTIDMPLGRLDPTFGWWMKPDPDGQPAVTKWKVLGRFSPPPTSEASGGEGLGVGGPSADSLHPALAEAPPTPNPSPPLRGGRGTDRVRGEGGSKLTWLALEPVTGRTHQLRVHCAAMGFAIFGDDIYGNEASQRRARQIKFIARPDAPGLQLHAREVTVPISKNREPVRVIAPVPPHLRARLAACGWNGE